jgi:hypothetical protein
MDRDTTTWKIQGETRPLKIQGETRPFAWNVKVLPVNPKLSWILYYHCGYGFIRSNRAVIAS